MTNITRDKDQLVNQIADLDFFSVRSNLQGWLQQQSQFTDYNFEGSNLTAILDLLAFSTTYIGFYLNVDLSESFLSTAIQRRSVVAKARSLSYIPRSTRSAVATLILNLTSTVTPAPSFISIPRGTTFISQTSGSRFTFTLLQSTVAQPNPAQPDIYSAIINIVEGNPNTQTFNIDSNNANSNFLLNNQNIDTSTLAVSVAASNSPSSSVALYALADGSTYLANNSQVYFLAEVDNLQYAIYFGDGVLGQNLSNGNVVEASYLISSADVANGASTFSLASTITGAVLSTNSAYPGIITVDVATGGATIEDVVSVKKNAPLTYQTQRRTVTPTDYSSIIAQNFSYVKSLAVWGGETNVPVCLGYTFISVLPQTGPLFLTQTQKGDIEQFLYKNFSVLSIRPVVVDPDYLFIRLNITLKYNASIATTTTALQQNALAAAIGFNQTFSNFAATFKYSKLVAAIDSSNQAITNSLVNVYVERRTQLSNVAAASYYYQYYNALIPGTLMSDSFGYISLASDTPPTTSYQSAFFVDDSAGNVSIAYTNLSIQAAPIVITPNVGTLDYKTGELNLNNVLIQPSSSVSNFEKIPIYAQPQINDISSARNGILLIDPASVFINTVISTG